MTETPDNNGRDAQGRFAKGNQGGPGGARRRVFDLRRAADEAIDPEHIAAIMRRAARMALEGNLAAMRFVVERTCGRATERPEEPMPLPIDLPRLRTANDCSLASQRIVEGIASGTVGREEAAFLMNAIQTHVKSIEANELEQRLTHLEQAAESVNSKEPSRKTSR
tara:strand:+ start:4926 stop:5423 length:498 start_codon:yes stop_codon:yes gene_type:complete